MSTTPDAIQTFAAAETTVLNSLAAALTNLATGVAAENALVNNFQNSQGALSAPDQAALDSILALSNANLSQAQAITTTTPGTTVPVIPLPATPSGTSATNSAVKS